MGYGPARGFQRAASVVVLDAAGRLGAASGDATTPGIHFTADTGLGLYRIGTNILGIATAGVEAMRVDANGDVGIGVSADPSNRLVVQDDVTGVATVASFDNGDSNSVAETRVSIGLTGTDSVRSSGAVLGVDKDQEWTATAAAKLSG